MTLQEASGADFSADRVYRRLLWRRWDESLPWLCMIMLNPSKAGAVESDPTVTRQIERAKRLNCGGLLVTNAFDLVATDPREMKRHPKPNTLENDEAIFEAVHRTVGSGGTVIAAWGKDGAHRGRDKFIGEMLCGVCQLHALAVTKEGQPGHPLYIGYDVKPFPWPVIEGAK